MADIEIVAASALCVLAIHNYVRQLKIYKMEKKKRRRRRWWMISSHHNGTLDVMKNFFNEMNSEESGEFTNFCRMSCTDFDFLLNRIEPLIKKETRLRIPISPRIRLAITLTYLSTGDSYRRLHYLFKVSTPAISLIIPEVCKALNTVLKNEIKLPQIAEEWLTIEEGFRRVFPRCVGAIDAKHILIKCPTHSGSKYNNYKSTYSIVLMALVDSYYNFVFADINKCISDGGIFQQSLLWHKIENNTLNLPPDTPLPGRDINVPYVFVSDGAFALHKNILNPFPGSHNIGTVESTFNNKLSSTRVIVENAFGMLSSVFRIFKKPIELKRETVPHIVMTCIVLHNFLRKSKFSENIYAPPGTLDSIRNGQYVEGSWRKNVTDISTSAIRSLPLIDTSAPRNITEIRSEFGNYFHNIIS